MNTAQGARKATTNQDDDVAVSSIGRETISLSSSLGMSLTSYGMFNGPASVDSSYVSAAQFAEKIIHSNIPDCVHVFQSTDANSSLRTQSAAAALNAFVSSGGRHHAEDQHYRTHVMNRRKKQKNLLINITPPSTLIPMSWEDDIKHKVVVFDGGIGITPPPDVSLFSIDYLFIVAVINHICLCCCLMFAADRMELHQCI